MCFRIIKIWAFFLILLPLKTYAAVINFSGQLDVVDLDTGAGIYAGTPIGTTFSGFIDDVTANGQISDGTTLTSFDCCIAAGALSVSNDVMLDAEGAALLNTLAGSMLYSDGDSVDGVDIEGDVLTATGGRIEVGLSYIFAADTFSDNSLSNYPFDPAAVQLALFFILEEDAAGNDIYSAIGQLNAVPVPAAIWLFGAGLISLVAVAKRQTDSGNKAC